MSSSGKLLQEVITNTPNIAMVGVKPSNIYVTLGTADNIGWYPHNLCSIHTTILCAFASLLGGMVAILKREWGMQF